MITTSDGSPAKVDPKQFLANYTDTENLQQARMPSGFDQLTKGKIRDDIKGKVDRGVIQV